MSAQQRILYFFPYNPIGRSSGAETRASTLLGYFKSRNFSVDLISRQGDWERIPEEGMEAIRKSGFVENAWFWFRKPAKKNPVSYFFKYKLKHLLYNLTHPSPKKGLPNLVNQHLRTEFDKILSQHTYDYIIISYVYYADLIKDNPLVGSAQTIIDTHDLMSSQIQQDKKVDVGIALGDEIARASLFDQVWACSSDEHYFFSQFVKKAIVYIPIMVEAPKQHTGQAEIKYELIYVASDNESNKRSAKWFFEKVYPLLPKSYRFCVIGKINAHIPQGLDNITYLPFVEDLGDYYLASKVVLCPMLTGTGTKVKVLEAFSYGKPVVCNERGQDGLPDKSNNGCLVSQDPAGFAAHINNLLNDPVLYTAQSAFSIASFRNTFTAEKIYKRLDTALKVQQS